MSRCWPTAETACSVAMSVGLAPASPMAGRPAAMAPDVTTTTRRPSPRSCATSVQSFSIDCSSISPSALVIDDVPTLTTTIIGWSGPSVGFVLEGERADVDQVALAGTGPGQRPVHTQALEPVLDVRQRVGVGHVRQRHGPLGRAAADDEGTVVAPLDGDPFGFGTVDHEGARAGHGRRLPGVGHEGGQASGQLGDALTRGGRDARAVPFRI